MSIDVPCACGARYAVTDDKAGRKMRCQHCQAVIDISARVIEPPPQTRIPPSAIPYIQDVPSGAHAPSSLHPSSGAPPASVGYAPIKRKNKKVATLLTFWLGLFGAQHFYMGKPVLGVILLALWIPLILRHPICVITLAIIFVWRLVDLNRYILMSDDNFNRRYNAGFAQPHEQPHTFK